MSLHCPPVYPAQMSLHCPPVYTAQMSLHCPPVYTAQTSLHCPPVYPAEMSLHVQTSCASFQALPQQLTFRPHAAVATQRYFKQPAFSGFPGQSKGSCGCHPACVWEVAHTRAHSGFCEEMLATRNTRQLLPSARFLQCDRPSVRLKESNKCA